MSYKGWVNDVIVACIAAGIKEYVVCAGARNLSAVVALADHAETGELGEITLFSHFEERAAGFFALGRTMQTGDSVCGGDDIRNGCCRIVACCH